MKLPKAIQVKLRNTIYTINIEDLPEHIVREAAVFGIKTTIRNSAAISANAEQAASLMQARAAKLKAGNWHDRG